MRYFRRILESDWPGCEADGWTDPVAQYIPSVKEAILLVERKHDQVNHPQHYTSGTAKCECGRTVECIDVVRHMPFNLGNVVKYIWRADLKNAPVEDLKKAAWYLADEIKRREAK